MTFAELPMPISSTLSLGVLVVACALHFMWHPLKSSFSDALDFLRTHRLPLGIALLAGLLSGGVFTLGDELKIGWVSGDFSSLNRDAFNLVRAGVQDSMVLLHRAFPPMPLMLLLPIWIVMLTVEVIRYPFRYGRLKIRSEEQTSLIALCVLSITWTMIFLTTRWMAREPELDLALSVAQFAFCALGTAGYQVWLARLVMEWATPRGEVSEAEDGRTAQHEVFARWHGVLWLGAFNMVWMGFVRWMNDHDPLGSWLVLFEMLFFFGPLPVAIAAGRGTFWQAGAGAVRCLWRCGFAMVSWALTAVLVLGLTRYVGVVLQSQFAGGNLAWLPVLLGSVTSALLGTWLLVTVMLVLYRQGFPSQDRSPT